MATRHTVIISDPVSMWSKLAWDADVFRDIQTSYPKESQPLAYAAINVCISAASLQYWVKEWLKPKEMAKETGNLWDKSFFEEVIAGVPEQSACAAIANTAKHSDFRERRWTNGKVLMEWEEGNEEIPSGYVLYHAIEDSHSEGFALSRFEALCRNWWVFLSERGLTDGHPPMPEWQRNKFSRIFPPLL